MSSGSPGYMDVDASTHTYGNVDTMYEDAEAATVPDKHN